jgi:hypothetical protein
MPFRMRVSNVVDHGLGLLLHGQLVEGSYMGPENVQMCDENGRWVHSTITQHSIESPKDWPVVPGDGSTLILSIAKPSSEFKLDHSRFVIGHGAVTGNSNRVDISAVLDDPAFWATWVPLHLNCEELLEPSLAWGVTRSEADKAYTERFQSQWDSGRWPFIRFGMPDNRYVEIEYAAGIEHQNRVWIGTGEGPRVLLGYDSGHFSFPTMRIQELLDIAGRMDCHPGASLLLLDGAYLVEGEPFPLDVVARWLRQSPGFQDAYLDAVLKGFAENVIPGLRWQSTKNQGWINNWEYSQRNPASAMSILCDEDFRFIRDFFRLRAE